jgi:hypothetical protein
MQPKPPHAIAVLFEPLAHPTIKQLQLLFRPQPSLHFDWAEDVEFLSTVPVSPAAETHEP